MYNRKTKRYEKRMACRQLLHSQKRWRLSWNVARHIQHCSTCQLLDPRGLSLNNTEVVRFRMVFDTRSNLAAGYIDHVNTPQSRRRKVSAQFDD